MPPSLENSLGLIEEQRRRSRLSLKLIDDDLESRDLDTMKFLCGDSVSGAKLEKMTRAIELFEELEKSVGTSDDQLHDYLQLVAECLQAADRVDLLKHMGYTRQSLTEAVNARGRQIPSFRLMLHRIVQEMTKGEVVELKFLLRDHGLSRKKLDESTDAYELFSIALQPGLITDADVSLLLLLLKQIGRTDLVDVAQQYQDSVRSRKSPDFSRGLQQTAARASSALATPSCKTLPSEATSSTDSSGSSSGRAGNNDGGHSAASAASAAGQQVWPQMPAAPAHLLSPASLQCVNDRMQMLLSEEADFPSYTMQHEPRGICVIINNMSFYHNPSDPDSKPGIKSRPGSNIDAGKLEHVFTKLGFLVHKHQDLTCSALVHCLHHYADADHERNDAFVCCLLTHGIEGHVYGSDCRLLPIKDLTQLFVARLCRSLSGKPKLFFVQACQGKVKQQGYTPALLETDDDTEPQHELSLVPDEADFLVGYATVPGYVSFRSPKYGSWYVNKLCEMLLKHADRYDLLSILTKVNDEVSKGDAKVQDEQGLMPGRFKQMPAPISTLRKRLFFKPLDSRRALLQAAVVPSSGGQS